MNLQTILVCLLQGLIEFTDAQCRFSLQNIFCKGVDSEGFFQGFYQKFREEYIAERNVIKISGGNWTKIDYFPILSVNGKYYPITSLAINDASIRQIDEHAFEDLQSLRSLDLSHNQLENTLFIKYIPSLEWLNLASNKIVYVSSFSYLSLRHLDMSYNRIRYLDFRNVSEIRVLDFSGNKIDSIVTFERENNYNRYDKFETSVNLSSNKITEFEEISNGQRIHTLDLSFNNLKVLQLYHEKRFLNLSNCNISDFINRLECIDVDLTHFQFRTTLKNQIHVTGKLKIQVERNSHLTNVTNDIRELVDTTGVVDLSYSSIRNIPAEAFRAFHQQSLILSHMNISELKSFTFQLSNFGVLDLSHSHIKVLRPNVFNGLTSDVINLKFNEISDIRKVFNKVDVRKINLSFNPLRFIGNHSFKNCDNLSEIILSNCLIEKIEPLAFNSVKNLGILDLSNNKLSILERNAFNDLPIMELNLGGNKIITIRSRAFSDLPALRSLNLSSINLRNMEMNAFVNLLRIENIDLSHNDIDVIPAQLAVGAPRLKTICFTNNNITSFNKFSNTNIRYFALEISRLGTLRADCFQGMYRLEELHFNNSDIRLVEPGSLNGLYNLYYLDSQTLFRHIQHIETDTFRDLRSLKMLNLSGLSIQTIESNSFRGLSNIQEMFLSKNYLARLNKDTFVGLHALRVLDLSFNNISEIDEDVFKPLKNLEELYLQHNGMSSIVMSKLFTNLSYLRKLRLDHNQIDSLLPYSLSGLHNLQELHLGSNKFTGWSFNEALGNLQYLSNLSVLNLSCNKLQYFEIGAFSNLVSLTVLNLTDTSLDELNVVGILFSMRRLKQLFLDRNHLISFEYERLLINLKNISYIGISQNDWPCKDLSFMMEHFNNKNVNYKPEFPVYDKNNIDGVGCIDDSV